MKNTTFNNDFLYSFPKGRHREPRITIKKGKYKGLIFDILFSGFVVNDKDNKFIVKYKIINYWNNYNNKIINDTDEKYMCECVYNFVIGINE